MANVDAFNSAYDKGSGKKKPDDSANEQAGTTDKQQKKSLIQKGVEKGVGALGSVLGIKKAGGGGSAKSSGGGSFPPVRGGGGNVPLAPGVTATPFKKGGRVRKTGLALLHKNEYVVPAKQRSTKRASSKRTTIKA